MANSSVFCLDKTPSMAPIMIMAGGTGGHVFPGLAVAKCLRAADVPVVWLGSQRGLENMVVPQAGFTLERISIAGLRGSGAQRMLIAPFMLLRAFWQALCILLRCKPRLVLGMGGFASGPGGLAARCLRTPLVIHEQNAVAGFTNRCLARFAQTVFEAFPASFPARRKALTVGNPVREEIASLPTPEQRFQARTGKTHLLVLGGSLGARALNQLLPQALAQLSTEQRPEVWHQTGERTFSEAESAYKDAAVGVRLSRFIKDMAQAYSWADLVVCRAGALTISELTAAGVGALLIPFPYAVDDHQTANARFLERVQAARIIAQAALTPELLATQLKELLSSRETLLAMAKAARQQARVDATEQVTALCLNLSGGNKK